ncbi:GNAT family N-acetyltransferase [Clostridium perfringens]
MLASEKSLYRNIPNKDIFTIESKEDNKVIGNISINEGSDDEIEDTKELGFVLNQNYHNRGRMVEVVYEILNYLFSKGI